MAYFFKLPLITDLTIGQQSALNDPNPIAITGGPGTGKSVVSLWRHIRNYGIGGTKSLLLTYTKTLQHYLSISASSENNDAARSVNRTYWWLSHAPSNYDEIIIDEAQDVDNETNNKIKRFSSKTSYGADNQQILDPKRATSESELTAIFKTNPYTLSENFRNSFEILSFCSAFFPNKLISNDTLSNLRQENRRGNKPIVITTNSKQENQIKAITDIINLFKIDIAAGTHNLAILVPLQKHVESFNKIVSSLNIVTNHTYYYEGLTFNGIENLHITTFKSAKGLEFDTVIIPDFQNYDWNIKNLDKAPITENDYYVAITRARRNLYLISTQVPTTLKGQNQSQTYTIEQY